MTYDKFKTELCKQIQKLLPSGTSIQLQTVYKNNGIKLDGLTISSSQSNISPTIFLNYYYEHRKYFPDMQDICRDIMLTYEHNRSSEHIDIDFFTKYESVKKRLAYRIINYEKNKELLQTVPHVRYLDLAIVFYCLLSVSEKANATILIHSSHMELWHVTAQELYQQTGQTTPGLLPYSFYSMSAAIKNILHDEPFPDNTLPDNLFHDEPFHNEAFHIEASYNNMPIEQDPEMFCPMYLLTNSAKLYGASCMLYPNLLENISKKLNADLFVLPSSIHELIILPASSRSQSKQLEEMVTEINRTELSADEVLSSHIYYYSGTEQALSICE